MASITVNLPSKTIKALAAVALRRNVSIEAIARDLLIAQMDYASMGGQVPVPDEIAKTAAAKH